MLLTVYILGIRSGVRVSLLLGFPFIHFFKLECNLKGGGGRERGIKKKRREIHNSALKPLAELLAVVCADFCACVRDASGIGGVRWRATSQHLCEMLPENLS